MKNGGPYEQHAFGAYVLFPWHDEDNYESHQFYKSIDEVNIGGLPFLPNSIKLVERLVERLVNSNPEELQEEGILPRGSVSHWESKLEEKTLVVTVNNPDWYSSIKREQVISLSTSGLKKGWEKAKYLALYVTQNVSKSLNVENGIQFFSIINGFDIVSEHEEVTILFYLGAWSSLPNVIKPVGYGIQNTIITTINLLKQSTELPELFMKFGEEKKLWRMLRRLSSKVTTKLDSKLLDHAKKIHAYQIGFYAVDLNVDSREIHVSLYDQLLTTIPLEQLVRDPSYVFNQLRDIIFRD